MPVINPAPLVFKMAELLLDAGLSHSRAAYPKAATPMPEVLHAMLDAVDQLAPVERR